MKQIGTVTHYFGKIGVAILKLSAPLKVGDTIKFQGHGADFEQSVTTMQVDHQEIQSAKAGDEVGMKVDKEVREGAEVLFPE